MFQSHPLYLITGYSIFSLAFYFFARSHLPVKPTIGRIKSFLFIAGITSVVTYIKTCIEMNLPPTILRILLLTLAITVHCGLYLCLFNGTMAQKFFVIMRMHFITGFIENLLWLLLILAVGENQAMVMEKKGWWSGEVVFLTFLLTSYWLFKRKKPDIYKQSAMMMLVQEMIIIVYFIVNLVLAIGTEVIIQGYFLFLSLLFFAYFISTERKEKENYEFQLTQQKYLLLEKQYEEMESYHEEVRIVKHDMKNHLLVLFSYLQQEDYQQVQKQLAQLVQTYPSENSLGQEGEHT